MIRIRRRVSKLNECVAESLADGLSTMWCFWAILFLVTIPLVWQRPDTAYQWAQYLSTAVFQAIALPVLAFVAKVEAKRQIKLLRETHDAELAELAEL